MGRRVAALLLLGALLVAAVAVWRKPPEFDPLATAREERVRRRIGNVLAQIPPQCYTDTAGGANPCWTCHTTRNNRNLADDWALQQTYAFNAMGRSNHWTGLYEDRESDAPQLSEQALLEWVRTDNYTPLREALRKNPERALSWRPDLNLNAGFDDDGFARDGSGWRAFRYKPFPGTFWPTNGATDDVAIRLPAPFRRDAQGRDSLAIYRINLAIVEAAVAVPDTVPSAALNYPVEPIDESVAGLDLDGDGQIADITTRIAALPAHYVGAASDVPVRRYDYPVGTEFLHTVRYLDPDMPDFAAQRLKELRYSRKRFTLEDAALQRQASEDAREQDHGGWPYFDGDAFSGLSTQYGWQLQGYIEDQRGRLRLQTREEQVYCMGCHGGIGVTVDSTFSLPRKPPGAHGWGAQQLAGMQDVPQAGSQEPEVLRYLQRAQGGDEFRANAEMKTRFFNGGTVRGDVARRAARGGAEDLRALILPTRERALQLDRAYLGHVHAQDYTLGREVLLGSKAALLHHIDDEHTRLPEDRVYKDGRLWLDWSTPSPAATPLD